MSTERNQIPAAVPTEAVRGAQRPQQARAKPEAHRLVTQSWNAAAPAYAFRADLLVGTTIYETAFGASPGDADGALLEKCGGGPWAEIVGEYVRLAASMRANGVTP